MSHDLSARRYRQPSLVVLIIHKCNSSLESSAAMANPFDDPSDYGTLTGQSTGFRTRSGRDFSSLQKSVTDAVLEIKQNTQTLHQLYNQIGETSDNETVRRRIARLQQTSMQRVQTATSGLGELFEITRGSADKAQEFAVKSIHQSVQKAANEFNTISESILEKLQEFPEPPRSGASPGYLDSQEVEVKGEAARLLPSPTKQQEQQQEFLEAAHMEENAERMEELQQNIGTLRSVMNEIVQMALVQGEQLDTIEGHVEEAYSQVDRGSQQLGTAAKYKKCSRKLCCVIITILLVILLIIVIIIVAVVVSNNNNNNSNKH